MNFINQSFLSLLFSFSSLQLAAVGDRDLLGGLAALGAVAFELLHDIHPVHDGAEDDVLPVQPGGLGGGDEKLGAVGVWAGVRHRHDP